MTSVEFRLVRHSEELRRANRLQEELKVKAVRAGLSPLATVVRKRQATLAPDRTGKLERSITRATLSARAADRIAINGKRFSPRPNQVALLIGPNKRVDGVRRASLAHLIEGPTKPHTLTPKNASVLRIGAGFARSARHPGTRGQPFIEPSLDAIQSTGPEMFNRGLSRYLRRLGYGSS